jgi:hypothetical protein
MRPRHALCLLFFGPLLAALPGLAADDPPPAKDEPRVRVTVAAVLANDKGDHVDPKLTCLARAIREKHPKLTSFRLGRTSAKSIALGGEETFRLVDGEGEEAVIRVKRCTEKPDRFCLKVKSPSLVGDITYSSVCGKYFPIDTNYTTQKTKDRVFIAIMVEPCAGGK